MGLPDSGTLLCDLDEGELPIGAWATFMIARQPEVERTVRKQGRNPTSRVEAEEAAMVSFQGMAPVTDGARKIPGRKTCQGDAASAHRRPGYSLSGCTPAEPDSASPGAGTIANSIAGSNGKETNEVDLGLKSEQRPHALDS